MNGMAIEHSQSTMYRNIIKQCSIIIETANNSQNEQDTNIVSKALWLLKTFFHVASFFRLQILCDASARGGG